MVGSMEMEEERRNPIAIFMAFGTKGDVYPIAAICAAFASDQTQYSAFLVTHSAHENLCYHLEESRVTFVPVKSPPALSVHHNFGSTGQDSDFELQKRNITREHREECLSAVERILGHDPTVDGDFIVINLFALEGWSLAELFCVRCVVAAPYVVPYSAPSSFECQFRKEVQLLYKYLQEAPTNKVCWKDVMHWMWPLFTENWGSWRSDDLKLSPLPFTDLVTGLPACHNWPPSPLLLYGFSNEIVEVPDYWPSNVRVCGFWFLPFKWQFSCKKCGETISHISSGSMETKEEICLTHAKLRRFLEETVSGPPIFIGLSSIGSMGFMENPQAFIQVIQTVIGITNYRFILFTAGYKPLDESIWAIASETSSNQKEDIECGIPLFEGRLFCFSGMIPYEWLFPRCVAAIHHGGSGSTAAALHAGIPQVICPFVLDQFYWAEKMHWLGVAPEPLKRENLVPNISDDMSTRVAANVLSRSITIALSSTMKARAREIAERISVEDGVAEAVNILKQEMCCSS